MSYLGLREGDEVRIASTGEVGTVVQVQDEDVTLRIGSHVVVVPAHELDLVDMGGDW